jgi:hypothetical protein
MNILNKQEKVYQDYELNTHKKTLPGFENK